MENNRDNELNSKMRKIEKNAKLQKIISDDPVDELACNFVQNHYMGQCTSPVNFTLPAWLDRQLRNPRKIEGLAPLLTATPTSPDKHIDRTNRLLRWKELRFLRLTLENQHSFPMPFLRNPLSKSKTA